MKSGINIIGFLILVALLVCSSCVREIVMDAGEKPTVVVECVISNTAPQTLHLRYTKGASKKGYEVVTEAEAVLHDLTDGKEAGRFVKTEDGVWTLNYEAEDEHEYRLEINIPGYETITAEQKMPERPEVRAERWCDRKYMQMLHNHGEWFRGTSYRIFTIGRTVWIYAMNYNHETGKREMAEYICGNARFADFNVTDIVYSPQLDTVSSPLTEYMGAPPPGVESYVYTFESGLYPMLSGYKMYKRYLRTDLILNDSYVFDELLVSGSFEGFYPVEFVAEDNCYDIVNDGVIEEPADDQGYLVFAIMSEEYEKYHDEALRFMELQESSQLSDIYLRDNIYTNINGGLGIFGAKAETKMVWSDSPTIRFIKSVASESMFSNQIQTL